MTLYPRGAHAPLTSERWEERRVRDAIRALVADAEAAYDPEALWPAHEWDGWQAALPLKNLYLGAAGVAWALDALRRRLPVGLALDPAEVSRRALEAFRREPDYMRGETLPEPRRSSLFRGETGIALVAGLLDPAAGLADEVLELVRANLGNDADELMFGVPGTLLAADELRARTGAPGWDDACRESAEALWARREANGLWTQRLWGETFQSVGPAHGLVGIVAALRPHLDAERRARLLRESAHVLAERATVEGGRANWLGNEPKLQWCAGAPGVIAHAADYLDEELLLAGAELVWEAGPLGDEKGAGICHGTAGNGYALLRTFERTGDERWLERARAFAVHALAQARRLPGRYSLFTGGLGAALYAADCLDAAARYPVLDGF